MPGFPGVGRFFLYRTLFLKETAAQLNKPSGKNERLLPKVDFYGATAYNEKY